MGSTPGSREGKDSTQCRAMAKVDRGSEHRLGSLSDSRSIRPPWCGSNDTGAGGLANPTEDFRKPESTRHPGRTGQCGGGNGGGESASAEFTRL